MRAIDGDALNEDLRDSYNELRKIYDRLTHEEDRVMCEVELSTLLEVLRRIKEAPALDVAPVVHGKWMLVAFDDRVNYRWHVNARCSECGEEREEIWVGFFPGIPFELANDVALYSAESVELPGHCPNCNAKMDGDSK